MNISSILRLLCATLWIAGVLLPDAVAAATNETAALTNTPPKPAEEGIEVQRVLRSYLQLQEQLHATLLAIEQARQEAGASARTNAEALTARLELLERALEIQRQNELAILQNSNRMLVTLAGVFLGVGFLILVGILLLYWRGQQRAADPPLLFPTGRSLAGSAALAALGPGGSAVQPAGAEAPGARLFGVIDRLEKRIHELEHASAPPVGNGGAIAATETQTGGSLEILSLIEKGQTLLDLGRTQEAMGCFDEALRLEPDHAGAHFKKGLALEKLGQMAAALSSYDRAIALDRRLKQAWLRKGGLLNQQERYSEAVQCYEAALAVDYRP
jgi:tetratricopeptide (TPR) repeat protein